MSNTRRRSAVRAITLAVAATALSLAGAISVSSAFATTSPTAAPAKTVTSSFTATLSSLDTSARTVVAQPGVLKTGKQYCTDHGLPSTDARCVRAWIVDAAGDKVTVTLSPQVAVTDHRGNPDCIGPDGFGVCPVSSNELSTLIKRTPLFRVDMENGQAIGLAAIYTP